MRQEQQPLLWAASWYARRNSSVVRKVRVSDTFNNDLDYIAFTEIHAVTRSTTTSGNGNEAVYVYGFQYDPDYLKIGLAGNAKTVPQAFHRVMQQVSTSNRMLPTLHHVFFTDSCRALEAALHKHFKNLDRWSYEGAGTEWFRVTLQEVKEAVAFLGK